VEVYDICMFTARAVLSGGIRRSACICLFSYDDEDMMTAKTGSWFEKAPAAECVEQQRRHPARNEG
jgi:ribonucleoside-diphosphate reductase alpha chain